MSATKIKWACPKCGAGANKHGRGGASKCVEAPGRACSGFLCECSSDAASPHGETLGNPCTQANCYHCGWGGTFPVPPKKRPAWAKAAAAAGWTPPAGWQP